MTKTINYFTSNIKAAIRQVLILANKNLDMENIGYFPRWLIFCVDLLLCICSLALSYLLITTINDDFYIDFFVILLIIIPVNAIYFIVFRTFSGLIRYSTFIDAIKIFFSSIVSFITLLGIDYTYYFINDSLILTYPVLLIYFTISFVALFFSRLVVKKAFEAYFLITNSQQEIQNVLIYGTNSNAIAIANAIKNERPLRFKILGFIDQSPDAQKKQILGHPIYYFKNKISTIIRFLKASAIIIADDNINRNTQLNIVNDCLEHNYKVYVAPLISNIKETISQADTIKNIQIEDLLEREPIVLNNKLIAKELFKKRVLVTGGAGSIGSEIARQIANYSPDKLIILDIAETPIYQIQIELKEKFPKIDIEVLVADVRDEATIANTLKTFKPDIIYHAAAYKHVPLMESQPDQAISVNVIGTRNVVDLSVKYGVKKFVFISTDKAVNPSNVMGASKRIAEIYVQAKNSNVNTSNITNTSFVTTRFGNVLGSNGSVVPLFKKQLENGGPITVTDPNVNRFFMTIPEACQLVLEAGAMGNGGEIYIFDMGEAVKIIDLAKKMIKLAGYTPYQDIDIKIIGLRPGEKLFEELTNNESTTIPTYNDKIMISKAKEINFEKASQLIDELELLIKTSNKNEIVKKMKQISPEFVSMNSSYNFLDKDVKTIPINLKRSS